MKKCASQRRGLKDAFQTMAKQTQLIGKSMVLLAIKAEQDDAGRQSHAPEHFACREVPRRKYWRV